MGRKRTGLYSSDGAASVFTTPARVAANRVALELVADAQRAVSQALQFVVAARVNAEAAAGGTRAAERQVHRVGYLTMAARLLAAAEDFIERAKGDAP